MKIFRLLLQICAFCALGFLSCPCVSFAQADKPMPVSGSRLAGISFNDPPYALPVQRDFQMAMLTASGDLGRTCATMESYGWRLASGEQQRADAIFNNTVDGLRGQGFSIIAQKGRGRSDVTVYTADRADKHLVLLWSAGESGLVLVMCQGSLPPSMRSLDAAPPSTALPAMPLSMADAQEAHLALSSPSSVALRHPRGRADMGFSPVGIWVGSYACLQGQTGVTIHIDSLRGERFKGLLHFYPTEQNPSVPDGSYTVFGDYDPVGRRILMNPGKWVKRPAHFANTIIMGSFDPARMSFRGYFQGISGCTSIEARRGALADAMRVPSSRDLKKIKAAKPHKAAKKAVKRAKPHRAKAQPILQEELPADSSPVSSTPGAGDSSIKLNVKP